MSFLHTLATLAQHAVQTAEAPLHNVAQAAQYGGGGVAQGIPQPGYHAEQASPFRNIQVPQGLLNQLAVAQNGTHINPQVQQPSGISGNGTIQGWGNGGAYSQNPYGTPQPDISVLGASSPYHVPGQPGVAMPLYDPLAQAHSLNMVSQRTSLMQPGVHQSTPYPYSQGNGSYQGWDIGGDYIQ